MPQFWFGVAVENIPPTIAKQLKLRSDQGVMVVAVISGSPAEKAGLKADDLLIELNGKPLTSQEELARAANTIRPVEVDTGKGSSLVAPSDIAYLRVTTAPPSTSLPNPAPRLWPSPATPTLSRLATVREASNGIEVHNHVLPNGSTVYVGPGYQVDSKSQSTNMRVLRDAIGKGDTLVLTQETDDAGNVKNSISDGKTSYTIEPGKLDKLPANLRPLAQQMLSAQIAPAMKSEPQTPDDHFKAAERQIDDLKKQISELQQTITQNAAAKPVPVNK